MDPGQNGESKRSLRRPHWLRRPRLSNPWQLRARRGSLLVLCAVGATLVIGGAVLILLQWGTLNGPPPLGPRPVSLGYARSTPPVANCANPARTGALVRLVVAGFDPNALTVSLDVGMCVPPMVLVQLRGRSKLSPRVVDGRGKGPPAGTVSSRSVVERQGNTLTVVPAYAEVAVGIRYDEYAAQQANARAKGALIDTVSVDTALARVVQSPALEGSAGHVSPFVSLGRLVVPLASTPSRYPFDWYATRGKLYVELGTGISTPPIGYRTGPKGHLVSTVPLAQIRILRDPEINQFDATEAVLRQTSEKSAANFYEVINLRLSRSLLTKFYVCATVVIPLLLAVLLVVVLFSRRDDKESLGVVMGITVASLLAILPIRLVLVPSDLSALSLVDYVLGFEVAALAFVACLAVVRSLW